MTNAEAIAKSLLYSEEFNFIQNYIECPGNDECDYPDGCEDCKVEWLEKKWTE